MKRIKVKIRRKESAKDLPLPVYSTAGSSGMDLFADVEGEVVIRPMETKLISSGIHISLPEGYEAQIRPRSGLALKHCITLLNTPGTIDSDYRGLISLIITNLGAADFIVKRGMRLAQMVINEVVRADFEEVEELDDTVRSHGGFGHTGIQ
ncbi:MAG TPA: dUTP diphosphatase [Candidatus Omnitrophota bacterium]|nr:dUTP diphosphatase [Candidatus Omnitrophota bacterium]